jgi:HK97 family phage major capsid protein
MDEKYLRDGIAYITAAIERIGEQAKAEGRARTAEERSSTDDGVAWIRDARQQLEQHAEIRKAAEAGAFTSGEFRAEPVNVNRAGDPFDVSTLSPFASRAELRARAETAIERMVEVPDSARAAMSNVMRRAHDPSGEIPRRIMLLSTPAYRSAFQKLVAGAEYALTGEEREAVSRAASLTGNAGGFAVPTPLDPTVILTNNGSANPFRQISRVVTTTVDEWNGVSTAGITAGFGAEAAEAGDNAPTLAQPSITTRKAFAFVPFSIEIGMDWAAMEEEMRTLLVDAKDNLEATKFVSGASGSNEPIGIITALAGGSSVVAPTTAEAFAKADVFKVANALPPRYRGNADQASWVAEFGTLNAIRQAFAGDNQWTDPSGGVPPRLLGWRAYESSAMDSSTAINPAATDTTNHVLLVGDFSRYVIVDRVGLTVEVIPHLFATANNRPSGSRGLYAYWRVGADSVDDNAFRVLNVPTTA